MASSNIPNDYKMLVGFEIEYAKDDMAYFIHKIDIEDESMTHDIDNNNNDNSNNKSMSLDEKDVNDIVKV